MQPKSDAWSVLKVLTGIFIGIVFILLFFRSHFILGVFLPVLRFGLITLGVILMYFSFSRSTSRLLRIMLSSALFLMVIEYGWIKMSEKRLEPGGYEHEVSLMTYNVFHANWRPDSTVRKIEQVNPDILVMQELIWNLEMDIDGAIRDKYPYKITALHGGTHEAIFSKYPIFSSQFLVDEDSVVFAHVVEIQILDKKVQLINVHLASPSGALNQPKKFLELFKLNYKTREYQLKEINKLADKNKDTFDVQILIGDLNTTPQEALYRDIRTRWVDLFDLVGEGTSSSFPNSEKIGPVVTLDYIMIRGSVMGSEAKVLAGGGSDHLALIGKIKL